MYDEPTPDPETVSSADQRLAAIAAEADQLAALQPHPMPRRSWPLVAAVPIPWAAGPPPPTRSHPKGFGRAPVAQDLALLQVCPLSQGI